MGVSYATPADVIKLYGPLSTEQQAAVLDWLARASAMLRGAVPDVDARIASGDLDPVLVSTAVINMVLRVLNNPRGLVAETVGPFRREFYRDAAIRGLYLTAEDLALLWPAGEQSPAKAATIRVQAGLGFARGDRRYGDARRW